jgi:HD-GYP domain-containing protein (c-di-GMP phosphodiesterase class II)
MLYNDCMSMLIEFLEYIDSIPSKSLDDFLDRVLSKIRKLTEAEAGTIFMLRGRNPIKWLEPMSIQNDKIILLQKKFKVALKDQSIASYVCQSGRFVVIDDAYQIDKSMPYRFNANFDEESGFKTQSILCFPLINLDGTVIGVVQLINRIKNGKPGIFTRNQVDRLISPINHIVGRAVERAHAVEKIAKKNKRLKERNRQLAEHQKLLEREKARTEEAFQISINLLAVAAELHDEVTGNHILRVNEYSYILAKHLGMDQKFCEEIRYSAQLHDVGKMSVNSAILKKKGALNADERREMDLHTYYGYEILSKNARLRFASEIAYCHHEKWDGTGYPRGLKGEEIPMSARIVQMADIYDALRSERPYKKEYSHNMTYKIIIDGDEKLDSKGHFDPRLIEAFKQCHMDMDRIWKDFLDKQ